MPRGLKIVIATLVAVWGGGVFLQMLLMRGVAHTLVLSLPVLALLWAFAAQFRWWIIIPVAFILSGRLYLGYSIMPHELAFLLAGLGLIPLWLTNRLTPRAEVPVPVPIVLLLAYLVAHGAYSLYILRFGSEGSGSVVRVYMLGIWALVFAMAFLRYGNARALRVCVAWMYGAALLRAGFGLAGYYVPDFAYGVLFRLYLPEAHAPGADLRHSSVYLAMLSLAYVLMGSSAKVRVAHALLMPAYVYLALVGGSRLALALLLLATGLFLLVCRRFAMLGVTTILILVVVLSLNLSPELLYRLPFRFRRTLSILVVHRETTDIHSPLASSDQWHFYLARRGRANWLSNPLTFMLGNPVRPFEDIFSGYQVSWLLRAEIAARMGYYESGLWTVLAVTGLVGALGYLMVLVALLRKPFALLVRGPPSGITGALALLALISLVNWVMFCWIAGHFPSEVVMFSTLAYAACMDPPSDRGGHD